MDFYKGLCEKCGISFTFRKDLYRHLRVFHNIEVNLDKDKERCNICDKMFSTVAALDRHKRKHKPPPPKLTCTECDVFTCRTRQELRGHLQSDHGIKMETKEMAFDSMEQFLRWKLKLEGDEGLFFTKRTGERMVNSKESRLYYICHRTRTAMKSGLGKRSREPSNKIDQTCPASLTVTKTASGKVSVKFYMTHTGHNISMGPRHNTHAGRTMVTGQIVHGPLSVSGGKADAMPRQQELEHSTPDFCGYLEPCNALCEKCGISFTFKKYLYRHLRVLHDIDINLNKGKEMCVVCDKMFSSRAGLEYHKKMHRPPPLKLSCTECGIFTCRTGKELRGHLECEHGINIETKKMKFDSMEQFLQWKLKMEDDERVFFMKRPGERMIDSKKSRLYYICHRARTTMKSSLCKRLRTTSIKINQSCPASLIVTKMTSGKISVTFYMTHVGHNISLRSLRADKAVVAGQIVHGPCSTDDDTVIEDTATPCQQELQCSTSAHNLVLANPPQTLGDRIEFRGNTREANGYL